MRAVEGIAAPVTTFGEGASCDYRAADIRRAPGGPGYCYTLLVRGERAGTVETSVPGRHNVCNSLAAIAAAGAAGVPAAEAAGHVRAFRGAHRRFEILGEKRGVTVADDYAHHPRELEVTLKAARELGYDRVWAVHQPFTYSRTSLLLDDFARVLQLADRVVLSEIMGSREKNTYGVYAADLAAQIPGCVWFPGFGEIARYVAENARAGDLVITLGCGDVYKCAHQILEELGAGTEISDLNK